MPERYEYLGESYIFCKGRWFYKNNIQVPMELNSQLNYRFGKTNYKTWISILPGCYGTHR